MTQDQKPVEEAEKEPIKVAFSLPQIIGGALAAATAATIGSQLGVAGTIVGAAVASIVGGVAGTLYSAGLDRTHRKVTEAINRGYSRVRNAEDYDPDAVRALGADDGSPVLPGLGDVPAVAVSTASTAATEETRLDLSPESRPEDRRRKVWKVMGLTAAAMFLLALVAITIVELGLGRALDGKGGTTISQVVRPSPTASAKPTPSATPTPTPTPTATSAEPSVTPTRTVPEPTATSVPSPTGPATPAPTGTSTP